MLNDEIVDAQRLVKTDAYQMSIGEVINMYRDGELGPVDKGWQPELCRGEA
jgi:hypothetical protein